MIRAIELHSAEALCACVIPRAPPCSTRWISGRGGIIVPDVQSVEEARSLVEYAKYYPLGARGFAFRGVRNTGSCPS